MTKRLTMLMGGLVLSTGMALAQTTVTGKVVSQEDGEPVIGASVKIAGTKTGTVTDVDGNFTLPNASKDAVLEVTYLGMEPKKVKASAKMKIMLVADSRNLDEVVVTAMLWDILLLLWAVRKSLSLVPTTLCLVLQVR